MFFAQQQHHHHLSSNSISISSVTTKRIRWERLDIARFFFPLSLSLSLCVCRAPRVGLFRDEIVLSKRSSALLYFFFFCLLCLLLLLLDDDDDDDDEKCARKEIQRIGIRGGFLKALWFFCPKCDSATRRIQRIRCIQNARFRRRKVVRVTLN